MNLSVPLIRTVIAAERCEKIVMTPTLFCHLWLLSASLRLLSSRIDNINCARHR